MEFLSGVLFAASFFGVFYCAFKLGQRNKQVVPVKVDDDSQQKAKRIQEGFQEMMTYDVTTALKGKKVT